MLLVCPGNADEKLRCEAATFIWIQEHCSEVPIPTLWGFGFVGGQSVRTKVPSRLFKTKEKCAVYQARKRNFGI